MLRSAANPGQPMLSILREIQVDGGRTVALAGKKNDCQGAPEGVTDKEAYGRRKRGRVPEENGSPGQSAGKVKHPADGNLRPGGKLWVNVDLVGAAL